MITFYYKRPLLSPKEFIALSEAVEKGAQKYNYVRGIQGNVRGMEKPHG